MTEQTLSNLMHEERRFKPPAELAKDANVTEDAYEEAERLSLMDFSRPLSTGTMAEAVGAPITRGREPRTGARWWSSGTPSTTAPRSSSMPSGATT